MRKHLISAILIPACMIGAGSIKAQNTNTFPGSGNVGIGTISPFTLLEVKKATVGALGPVIRLTGGGGTGAQCAIDRHMMREMPYLQAGLLPPMTALMDAALNYKVSNRELSEIQCKPI